MEIERSLTAEFATSRIVLPHSRKPLVVNSDGSYDKADWDEITRDKGPAARLGDQIQITRVHIEKNRILLEINGGAKGAGHWYDHVQVGMGGAGNTGMNPNTDRIPTAQEQHGSYVEIKFPDGVPSINSTEIRHILNPIFDFEKHTVAEQYADRLPEPIKKAIKEQHAIAGMDKDQVLLAMGKPVSKSRETNADGDELEDWMYGEPPGKVTFVRFKEDKVVTIEDSYANVGGTTAPPLPPVR